MIYRWYSHRQQIVEGFGGAKVVLLNTASSFWNDLYHRLLNISWAMFWLIISCVYVLINLLFGFLYMTFAEVANASKQHLSDYFFFSVQTLATIGYGNMHPQGIVANLLVTAESLVGLLGVAMITGLAFARFSNPSARVLFSKVAVITKFNGVPTLMFRMANQRSNQILEAQVRVTCVRHEVSAEGFRMRRFYDLALIRSETPVFFLTWLVMHPINEASPLHNKAIDEDTVLVVTLIGIDDTFSQTIYARHDYRMHDIRLQHHFMDVITETQSDEVIIDYSYFHKTMPDLEEFSDNQ
ncbi:MAG: ion channel [Pseudanabaenaceae cyanobacterium SKYGB_i_bin29]|nr:ion channel [Pseudanabaenaceae cyanobacterium SKYG29]MDW8422479.1 ion channel [Pseudanabaenaceae cyanobacterium SKYGB_i_bin29]